MTIRASGILVFASLFSFTLHAQYPTCQLENSDSDGDGYGWENNETCVVADDTSSPHGYPICQDANSDPDGDGYGWENNDTCVVNGDSAGGSSEHPACEFRSSDPDGDGWGYENNESCRIGPSSIDDLTPAPEPEPEQTQGCVLNGLADFAQVASNCSTIDLQGRIFSGDLSIDENNSPTNTLTLQNGTIDGSQSSADACLIINRTNVTLNNIKVQNCHFGIHVRPSADRNNASGRFDFNDVQVVGTEDHGILLGYHASRSIEEDITLRDVYIRDIGVDGIAGDIGAGSTFELLGDSQISFVDQAIKEAFNSDFERICSPSETHSQFMGDCVHLQSMRGSVLIDGATCDHRDMPTKNGWILQNQHDNPLAGSANIRNTRVFMSDRCATEFGHSPASRDSKGIQLDKIMHIDLSNNQIRNAQVGIVVNNGHQSCDIAGHSLVLDSTERAFGGTGACNTDEPQSSSNAQNEGENEGESDPEEVVEQDPALEKDYEQELDEVTPTLQGDDEEALSNPARQESVHFAEGGCSHFTSRGAAAPFSIGLFLGVLLLMRPRRSSC